MSTPDYYNKQYKGVKLDPYRIASIYGITDHSSFQALKKILVAGQRGAKEERQDIEESIVALQRKLEMMDEDQKIDVGEIPPINYTYFVYWRHTLTGKTGFYSQGKPRISIMFEDAGEYEIIYGDDQMARGHTVHIGLYNVQAFDCDLAASTTDRVLDYQFNGALMGALFKQKLGGRSEILIMCSTQYELDHVRQHLVIPYMHSLIEDDEYSQVQFSRNYCSVDDHVVRLILYSSGNMIDKVVGLFLTDYVMSPHINDTMLEQIIYQRVGRYR